MKQSGLIFIISLLNSIGLFAAEDAFPENFLWGAATAEFQVSGAVGCPDSNWAQWEKTPGKIREGQRSGLACNHFNEPQKFIKAVTDLGCNAYRFSIEWSKYEPKEGVFVEEVLDRYSKFIDALLSTGVTPMITLHHFTEPQWFTEKGAFLNPRNSHHFILFAQKVFQKLGDRVHLWVTFNEPTVYGVGGYCPPPSKYEAFPPGINDETKLARVYKNILSTHAAIYSLIKNNMPHGKEAKVGIVHQFLKFEADMPLGLITDGMQYRYHSAFFEALKTGQFKYKDRVKGESYKPAREMIDFIGVNYYSKPLLRWMLAPIPIGTGCRSHEFMTDMPYRYYPAGLYEVLMEAKELGVPIYITENGAPDKKDTFRGLWIRDHLSQVKKAIHDGCDIRGFFYWSLVDNWEWNWGYTQKFGLYEYNFQTGEMKLREGAKEYVNAVKAAKLKKG